MLESGAVVAEYQIMPEVKVLQTMIRKYEDLPMSLADACLVRMAELRPNAVVLTLDHHFSIYRKNGAEPITTITP
jgi:predicted nucleic acid-binding protein